MKFVYGVLSFISFAVFILSVVTCILVIRTKIPNGKNEISSQILMGMVVSLVMGIFFAFLGAKSKFTEKEHKN
jgi:hypothetical protein